MFNFGKKKKEEEQKKIEEQKQEDNKMPKTKYVMKDGKIQKETIAQGVPVEQAIQPQPQTQQQPPIMQYEEEEEPMPQPVQQPKPRGRMQQPQPQPIQQPQPMPQPQPEEYFEAPPNMELVTVKIKMMTGELLTVNVPDAEMPNFLQNIDAAIKGEGLMILGNIILNGKHISFFEVIGQ